MPEQISLDDSSYHEICERAMEKIRLQAPWWTHTEVSDTGVMLTEMWALLSDMQSYYLDQIQEGHYRKYLKLLGVPPDEGECAWTWIFFDCGEDSPGEGCIVPMGTKLLSDKMVFETAEEVRLTKNSLTGFYKESRENRVDVMELSRKSRFMLQDTKEEGRVLFSFDLREALEPDRDFRFFVMLSEKDGRKEAGKGFYMAQLAWEYETESGWREAAVVRDDTRGLLFSGIVCLSIGSAAAAPEKGIRRIRCRIKEGAYDVLPTLYKICLNVVKAVQKDTLACEENVKFTETHHKAAMKSYLGRTGRLLVLREIGQPTGKREDGRLWEDITDDVRIDAPITADCMERYVSYAGQGNIKIVCTADKVSPEDCGGRITGIASQRIALPWNNVMRPSLELMLKQGLRGRGAQYRTYRREEPEEERYPNAWHMEDGEDAIVLGDGRHGEIPPPSEDGLRITSLILWEGEKGNVSVDRITKWEKPELFPAVTFTNRLAGRNGRGRKEPSRQFMEIQDSFSAQRRMVTEEDIRTLAKGTPGLLIDNVEARWDKNQITVTVFPKYPLQDTYCVQRYRGQVEKHLEPYRLAGTKIRIEIGAQGE